MARLPPNSALPRFSGMGINQAKVFGPFASSLFSMNFFSMNTLHLVVLMILEGVDRNVDSQVTATIVHY